MKIDKKIKAMPWPEPFEGGNQHFAVTISWPVIDHERLLVATFRRNLKRKAYYGKPEVTEFRLVCSKKYQTAAILYKDAKSGIRRKLDDVLYDFATSAASCYPEISPADENALAKWLHKNMGDSANHMMPELRDWVSGAVDAENLRERDAKGELRDEDVSLCPNELPTGLVEYIRREVIPRDNVLLYKKGNVRGTCYLCGHEVRATVKRFTQNGWVNCPDCGREVYTLLETSDRFKVDYVQNIASIQKGTDGKTVFIRLWHLCRDYSAEWENIPEYLEEVARWGIRGRKAAKWYAEGKDNYYYNATRYKLRNWTRMKNLPDVYDGFYDFYIPTDWDVQVENTTLQYCDLAGYRRTATQKRVNTNQIRFLVDWARYPAVEKLWKAGYTDPVFHKMTSTPKECQHTIRWTKDAISEAIRFPKRLLKLHAPADWTIWKLKAMTEAWDLVQAGRIREKEIPELLRCSASFDYFRAALGHASVHKIVAYLEKRIAVERARHPDTTYFYTPVAYRDYLKDCIKLGWNLNDLQILLPPNLDAAHQRTTEQVKYEANRSENEKFQKTREKKLWMEWTQGDLLIRMPRNGEEIIREGQALHHCVGGYVNRAAEGSVTILFVRLVAAPDTPYYTLEWNGERVVQCRTTSNRDYRQDQEVYDFVTSWVSKHEELKKMYRKENAA